MRHTVFKIYDRRRIYGDTEITGLEMEMRACRPTGTSTKGYRISGLDNLIRLHKET